MCRCWTIWVMKMGLMKESRNSLPHLVEVFGVWQKRNWHFKTNLNVKCDYKAPVNLDMFFLFDPLPHDRPWRGETHQSRGSSWVWDVLDKESESAQRWKLSPRPWKHFEGGYSSCSDWLWMTTKVYSLGRKHCDTNFFFIFSRFN